MYLFVYVTVLIPNCYFTQCSETLDDATSLTRATGRQRRHSSILKVSCWAAAHHQHNSNPQHFKATGIRIAKTLHAFYQFCRPHTIFGTVSPNFQEWDSILYMSQVYMQMSHAFIFFLSYIWTTYQIIGITSVSLLPVKSLDDFTLIAIWGFLEV
jgi:homogentisate phytyltransferase / homogentisate geranylgeranyltransferase